MERFQAVKRREFVSGIVAAGAASFCGGCSRRLSGFARVRIGLISDTHVTGPESIAELSGAFSFLRELGVDAVVHCGDMTDFGYVAQLEAFAEAWKWAMPPSVELIPVLGNRDLTETNKISGEKRAADYGKLLLSDPAGHVRRILGVELCGGVRAVSVKGLSIVCADWGHEASLEKFMMSDPALRDPSRPFLHVQHPHPGGTAESGEGACSDPAGCWLNMFPKAVAVSGHSHLPFTDPSAFIRREFTFVAAGSHYLSGGPPQKGIREVSVLEIDDNGVRVERFGLHNASRASLARRFDSWPSDVSADGSFVLASWNVGGFVLGQGREQGGASPERAALMRSQLKNLNADILALAEYDPEFKMGACAVGEIFGDFPHSAIGPRLGLNGNSYFSRRFKLSNVKVRRFSRFRQPRYCICCEAEICARKTLMIQTHLDLDEESRKVQLAELLEMAAPWRHAIISGDFNIAGANELSLFADGGFSMANHGRFGALPTHRRRRTSFTPAIDNVLVKGFDIVSAWLGDESMVLSDHRIFAVRLKPKDKE